MIFVVKFFLIIIMARHGILLMLGQSLFQTESAVLTHFLVLANLDFSFVLNLPLQALVVDSLAFEVDHFKFLPISTELCRQFVSLRLKLFFADFLGLKLFKLHFKFNYLGIFALEVSNGIL
jgi:hypothetical protein